MRLSIWSPMGIGVKQGKYNTDNLINYDWLPAL